MRPFDASVISGFKLCSNVCENPDKDFVVGIDGVVLEISF